MEISGKGVFMKKIILLIALIASVMTCFMACDKNVENKSEENAVKNFDVTLVSQSFDYDGNAHSLSLEGELPANASVKWSNNSLTEVGETTVYATLKCVGYKEVTFKAQLKIVGKDLPSTICLENSLIEIDYGEEYQFGFLNLDAIETAYTVSEIYVDKKTGETYEEKPNYGGEFIYTALINAKGYNVKKFSGELYISNPSAESIKITNLPRIIGEVALLKGMSFAPITEITPKGHLPAEIEFFSNNEDVVIFENGKFNAINYGGAEIGVKIKGTDVSYTRYLNVREYSYSYEDFESDKPLFKEADDLGVIQERIEGVDYLGAHSSVGTTSKIIDDNGNKKLQVNGAENYSVYYSFLSIDMVPSGGWTPGIYHFEMDVTGKYDFICWWTRNLDDGTAYYNMPLSGALSNGSAIIEDGKIVINLKITENDLGDSNTLRLAQSSNSAFEFTVDNILLIKVSEG